MWLNGNEWIMVSLNNTTKLPQYEIKQSDFSKMKHLEKQSTTSVQKSRSEAADQLFAPKSPLKGDVGADSLATDMSRIGNALNERGEKLNRVEEKA